MKLTTFLLFAAIAVFAEARPKRSNGRAAAMQTTAQRSKRDCHPSQFRCQNGACISMDQRCNGIVDCLSDAYDEINCQDIESVSSDCKESEFLCETSEFCIDGRLRCNGYPDCRDASDERDCQAINVMGVIKKVQKVMKKIQSEMKTVVDGIKATQDKMNTYQAEMKSSLAGMKASQAQILSAVEEINDRSAHADQRVRLVGSSGPRSTTGRLEVFVNDRWGTVCDDSFESAEGGSAGGSITHRQGLAKVVCRMLGRNGGTAFGKAKLGQGSGDIVMDDVKCNGDEHSIFACPARRVDVYCNHDEDVGVTCT